jgi:hypothetical protein
LLPVEKQRYRSCVEGIDAANKTVTLADGTIIHYDKVQCWDGCLLVIIISFECTHVVALNHTAGRDAHLAWPR